MARPKAKELTERELEIMQVFWSCGPGTAAEIRDQLSQKGLDRAYTTIATLIRILQDKGFVRQLNEERPYRYEAAQSYEAVSGRLLGDLVERVFGGSREQLMVRLLEKRKLTKSERELLLGILKEKAT